MKDILVILLLIITIASCGRKNYSKEFTAIDSLKEECVLPDTIIPHDTIFEVGNDLSSPTNSHYYEKETEQVNDNMRGFDPASEDDMDDNGMSRYMENDDEEGWD